MSNFNQAIKWLMEGKRIRRPVWKLLSYWEIGSEQRICYVNGLNAHVHLNQIEAMDWEIYEDAKLKVDKIIIKAVKGPKPLTKEEMDYFDKWHKEEFGEINDDNN